MIDSFSLAILGTQGVKSPKQEDFAASALILSVELRFSPAHLSLNSMSVERHPPISQKKIEARSMSQKTRIFFRQDFY